MNEARNSASILCHPSIDMKNVTLMEISRCAPCALMRFSALTLCWT